MKHHTILSSTALSAMCLVIVGAVTGCTKMSSSSTSPDAHVLADAMAPTSVIKGLVTMGDLTFKYPGGSPDNSMAELNAHPNVYVAAVINATWAGLEPNQRGSFDFTSIETGLTAIQNYNAAHSMYPVVAKLRVFAGVNVPAWLVTLSGSPVTVTDPGIGSPVQYARFWTDAYHQAWVELQQALAARYNTNPLLRQVSITSCATSTFEPFIRPVDSTSRANMLAAGYTDAADIQCIQDALGDYSVWTLPALDFPFNPLPLIDPIDGGAAVRTDTNTPVTLMQLVRTTLGDRLVLAQEGLNQPMDPTLGPIYDELKSLGGPIQFQTHDPTVPWDATIMNGLAYKPTQIEIWDTTAVTQSNGKHGTAPLTQTQLQGYAAMVAAD